MGPGQAQTPGLLLGFALAATTLPFAIGIDLQASSLLARDDKVQYIQPALGENFSILAK